MGLDKQTKKEIKEVAEKATKETLAGTLSKMLGNESKETTAVPRPETPKSTTIITPHERKPPNVPKPPMPGTRKRRHPMAVKGEIRFWCDTIIEIIVAATGIAFVITLLILIIKWGQWLWRAF